MHSAAFCERDARIGIAASCLFFVVVFPRNRAAMSLVALDGLRSDIEQIAKDDRSAAPRPPPTSSGGSSSGPAELPVVERNSN